MWKEDRLLKHISNRAIVRFTKNSGVVLPNLSANGQPARNAIEAGDAAKYRGFAGSRGPKDRRDSVHGRFETHIQFERAQNAAETSGDDRLGHPHPRSRFM